MEDEYGDRAIVEYDEEDAMFILKADNIINDFSHISSKWTTVIGNIHEKKEK